MSPAPPSELARDAVWRALVRLVTLVAVGWLVALLGHHLAGTVFGRPYPANTFLFDPGDRYNDLVNSWRQAQAGNPYIDGGTSAVAAYFPLVYLVLRVARALSRETLIVLYVLVTYAGLGLAGLLFLRHERARWRADARWPAVVFFVTLLGVLCYPLLFAVDRGNLDPLLALLLVAAWALIERGKFVSGALLVAVAAASKGYPLVWFALWLKRRGYRGLALGLGATFALVCLPGLCFEGGLATTLAGWRGGLDLFRAKYVVGPLSAHFSADAINGWRLASAWVGHTPDMRAVVSTYEAAAAAWAAALAFFALFVARSRWRELLALTLVMLVFPNVINDYKLVLLLPALLAWVAAPGGGWRDHVFWIAAALLMVPKHYFFLRDTDASISCVISPLLLVALSISLYPTPDEIATFRQASREARARVRPWIDRHRHVQPTAPSRRDSAPTAGARTP